MFTNKREGLLVGLLVCALALSSLILCAQEAKQIPQKFDPASGQLLLDSSRFQSRIRSPRSLGEIANELSVFGKGDPSMGFAAKSEEAKTFLIGSFYSETLAYGRTGRLALAVQRLRAIQQEFINMGVSSSLYVFVNRMEYAFNAKRYEPAILVDFFSLFQPLFEDYLNSKGRDPLILFRAGSWLMDMALAASVHDTDMLKQPAELKYFIEQMARMDAPKGVLNALNDIDKISKKSDITDQEAEEILKLVKKIQQILG